MVPRADLEPHKFLITAMFYDKKISVSDIAAEIGHKVGVKVSGRTIRRYLRGWGVEPHRKHSTVTPECRERIIALYIEGKTDKEAFRILKKEGYDIEKRRLQRVRLERDLRLLRKSGRHTDAVRLRETLELGLKRPQEGFQEGHQEEPQKRFRKKPRKKPQKKPQKDSQEQSEQGPQGGIVLDPRLEYADSMPSRHTAEPAAMAQYA